MAQGRHRKEKRGWARLWRVAAPFFVPLAGRLAADWLAHEEGWSR